MGNREIIYRLGNKEERQLYRQGKFPLISSNRSPFFSNDLKSVFEYKEATKKGKTQSKNNKMNYLYTLVVEYNPKETIKFCTVRSKGKCKAFFFRGKIPKIIMVHSQRIS